jgi:phosphoglycerate kinase
MILERLPVFNDSVDVSNKRVIVRVDFNVPVEKDLIVNEYRIARTLPLLWRLRDKGARLVLLSHLTEKKEHRSFELLVPELCRATGFDIAFAPSVAEAQKSTAPVVLLENLRAFSGEEAADNLFAKKLASLGEVYINEAFSQSHRPYASVIGLPKFLPTYFGPLFFEEVKKLSEVLTPAHPFLLLLGGVKFETKIGVLEHFLNTADTIFIGGALVNTFLAAQGLSVGSSPIEYDSLSYVRSKFLGAPNLILPSDVRVEGNEVRLIQDLRPRDIIYDIGPQSVVSLSQVIHEARMVLWNGPMGFIERGYEQATTDLVETFAAVAGQAKIMIGGGDTMAIVQNYQLEDSFYHLSTGGGAMLEFLAKGTLPGIEAVLENPRSL